MGKTRPFIGQKSSFTDAFPEVEEISVEVKQSGEYSWEHQLFSQYNKHNIPSIIPCANPMCQQGGFSLKMIIYGITSLKKTEEKRTICCDGHEGSPKGRRKGDPCDNYVEVKISVSYK